MSLHDQIGMIVGLSSSSDLLENKWIRLECLNVRLHNECETVV